MFETKKPHNLGVGLLRNSTRVVACVRANVHIVNSVVLILQNVYV